MERKVRGQVNRLHPKGPYDWVLARLGIPREITWILFDSVRTYALVWVLGAFLLGIGLDHLMSSQMLTGLLIALGPALLLAHVFWAGRKD